MRTGSPSFLGKEEHIDYKDDRCLVRSMNFSAIVLLPVKMKAFKVSAQTISIYRPIFFETGCDLFVLCIHKILSVLLSVSTTSTCLRCKKQGQEAYSFLRGSPLLCIRL